MKAYSFSGKALDVTYLSHGGIFVDGNENFVEKGLKVIPQDSVHDESLEWRNIHIVVVLNGNVEINQSLPGLKKI